MLKTKIIGVGAAGNKAAINLIEKGVIEKGNVLLLNSTKKDIPDEYKGSAIEFGTTRGCGKERDLAKQMIMQALAESQLQLENFLRPDDVMVVIVTSLEGGTGCGSSVVLAKYIQDIIITPGLRKNLRVHLFGFAGFEDDVRGLKNTVDWFNDLEASYTVQVISNKKFLTDSNSREQAEQLANDEFARRINILMGNTITPSARNLDDRDLLKVSNTPGFMTIEAVPLMKIKDKEQFDGILNDMVYNSKSLETEQSCKRIGLILNISPKSQQYIDESFSVLTNHYGTPFELFRHYQNTEEDDFLNIIISGMKLPIDAIKEVYQHYKKQMEKIDVTQDTFFNKKFDTSSGNKFNTVNPFDQTTTPDVGLTANMDSLKEKFFSSYGGGVSSEESKKAFDKSIRISSQL